MIRSASRGDAPRGAVLPLVVTGGWTGEGRRRAGCLGGRVQQSSHGRPRPRPRPGPGPRGRPGAAPAPARPGVAPAGGPARRPRRRVRLPPGRRRGRLADGGPDHVRPVGRPPGGPRVGRQPQPAHGRSPGAGVRDGDPGRRPRARPVGLQPLGQLPVRHGLRPARARSTTRRTSSPPSRRCPSHVAPGQWAYARSPSAKELAATTVLRLALDEASVKVERGAARRRRGRPRPRRVGRCRARPDRPARPGGRAGPARRHRRARAHRHGAARPGFGPARAGSADRGDVMSARRPGDRTAQATNLDERPVVHAVGLGHRLVHDRPVHHVDALGQRRVRGHGVLPAVVGDVEHVGQGGVDQCVGRRVGHRTRHVGHAVEERAVDLEGRVRVGGGSGRLEAAALVDRDVDEHGAVPHPGRPGRR